MNVQPTIPQRKRKALLVLPLVVIPFLTMAFWAMGGGEGEDYASSVRSEGLNLLLPKPELSDDSDKTKLSFYEAEEKADNRAGDSAMAPSFRGEQSPQERGNNPSTIRKSIYDPTPPNAFSSRDQNEEKVYQKVAELNKQLTVQSSSTPKSRSAIQSKKIVVETEDVNRLAEMMGSVQTKGGPDPELEQLNSMMEKILDIQHPDRVKEKLQQQSSQNKQQVYPVTSFKRSVVTSLLQSGKETEKAEQHNSFLDEKNGGAATVSASNAIAAVIQENSSVTAGSTVKLRLLTEVFISGYLLSKGSFVYGVASLEEDRLKISIPSIRYKDNLLPVSLSVYDLDGLEGVHIPGSISRDAAKGSAEQSLQSIGLLSLDPTLKAQATAAAVQAAKGLLSRKVKRVRVVLKSGYQVLLKNQNTPE
jgi:conjugative transposon TraM protein